MPLRCPASTRRMESLRHLEPSRTAAPCVDLGCTSARSGRKGRERREQCSCLYGIRVERSEESIVCRRAGRAGHGVSLPSYANGGTGCSVDVTLKEEGEAKAYEVGRNAGLWVSVHAGVDHVVDVARYGREVVLPRSWKSECACAGFGYESPRWIGY